MDENTNVNEEINNTEGNEEVENAESSGANEPAEIVSAKPQFLMVKKQNGEKIEWIPIPALRGTSVYLSADVTEIAAGDSELPYGGYKWTIFDEKKLLADPTYKGTEVKVFNGQPGNAITVDMVSQIPGEGEIPLTAVRYGVAQSLSSDQKAQARENIGAMPTMAGTSDGDIIIYRISNPTNESDSSVGSWTVENLSLITTAQITALFTSQSTQNSSSEGGGES